MYDYLIVGAGLSGAIFAHEATKRGKKVKVIDKRDHIGGNIYCENVEGIKQMNVMILSQIGKPIDQPKAASTQVILEDGVKLEDVDKKVEQIVDRWLEDISIITENVVQGKTRTF